MRQITYTISAYALCLVLVACGEISYKRGGTAQDIERAHQACRGKGDGFTKCLEAQGWESQNFTAFDPLFATVTISDNRQDAANTKKTESEFLMVPIATNEKSNEDLASIQHSTSNKSTVSQTTPNHPASQKQSQTSTINDGPDVTYVINSWWKMGAGAEALKSDQNTCEKKLGTAYIPDYKTRTFKRAFIVCMHERDWKALRELK